MTQYYGRRHRISVSVFLFFSIVATNHLHANKITYIYTDAQGNVLANADAQGNIVSAYDYKPYGGQAMATAPDGPSYTGHVNDIDTSLIYMQARFYDPMIARFLSIDPKPLSASDFYNFDRFAYGNSNPIRNIDPDGRNAIITHNLDGSISIQVPVNFSGPAANQQNIDAIKADVSTRWSGLYEVAGEITKVSVSVVDVTDSTPKAAINSITLLNGPTSSTITQGGSFVQNKREGEWNMTSYGMKLGEAAHETGHLMGDTDHIDNSTDANGNRITAAKAGYANNLMGELTPTTMTDNRNMDAILHSPVNIQQTQSSATTQP